MLPWVQSPEEVASIEAVTLFLHLGMSSILDARGVFPSCAFTTTTFCGVECPQLVIAKKNDIEPKRLAYKVATVNAWVFEGLKGAIERRYLKSVTLAIMDGGETPESLEHFTFRFEYPCSETVEVALDYGGEKKKGDATAQLRDVLGHLAYVTAHQEALDASAKYFALKIAYTRLAPPNYVPKHFDSCNASDLSSFKTTDLMSIKIGEVSSNAHAVRLLYKGPPVSFASSNESGANEHLDENAASLLSLAPSDTNNNNNKVLLGNQQKIAHNDDDVNDSFFANTLESTQPPVVTNEADDDETRISIGSQTRRDNEASLNEASLRQQDDDDSFPAPPSLSQPKNNKRRALADRTNVISSQDSEDWTSSARRYAKSRRLLSF